MTTTLTTAMRIDRCIDSSCDIIKTTNILSILQSDVSAIKSIILNHNLVDKILYYFASYLQRCYDQHDKCDIKCSCGIYQGTSNKPTKQQINEIVMIIDILLNNGMDPLLDNTIDGPKCTVGECSIFYYLFLIGAPATKLIEKLLSGNIKPLPNDFLYICESGILNAVKFAHNILKCHNLIDLKYEFTGKFMGKNLSCFYYASHHLDIIKYLVECGANPHDRTSSGNTALHDVCDLESFNDNLLEVTKYLVEYCGVKLDKQNNDGMTALMNNMYCHDRVPIVEYMITMHAKHCNINARNISGKTALYMAANANNLNYKSREKVIHLLLDNGADPTIAENDENLPLIALSNHPDMTFTIIQKMWNIMKIKKSSLTIDVANNIGQTILMNVVKWGCNKEIFHYLLNEGANIFMSDIFGKTVLMYGCDCAFATCFDSLICAFKFKLGNDFSEELKLKDKQNNKTAIDYLGKNILFRDNQIYI